MVRRGIGFLGKQRSIFPDMSNLRCPQEPQTHVRRRPLRAQGRGFGTGEAAEGRSGSRTPGGPEGPRCNLGATRLPEQRQQGVKGEGGSACRGRAERAARCADQSERHRLGCKPCPCPAAPLHPGALRVALRQHSLLHSLQAPSRETWEARCLVLGPCGPSGVFVTSLSRDGSLP